MVERLGVGVGEERCAGAYAGVLNGVGGVCKLVEGARSAGHFRHHSVQDAACSGLDKVGTLKANDFVVGKTQATHEQHLLAHRHG